MTRIIRAAALVAAVCLTCAGAAFAQPAARTDAEKAEIARVRGILAAEHPQFDDVRLAGADVTLHLGRRFYLLGPDEARQVLKEWGNPPEAADGVLGIIFPAGKTFVDNTWGAVVTFDPSGYVTDKDADKADYDKLIRDVQGGEDQNNEERKKNGFPPIHLVGWAQPPSYDRAHHYLIWARDLKFGGQTDDTLNYDLRVLGRRGVLSVNLVSTMPDLAAVREDASSLAAGVAFNPGSAYGDFQAGHDKTAEYGVAGLVAAGVGLAAAQKFGLLAVILLFAKKALVFILAGFAGVAAWFRRILSRRKPPTPTVEAEAAAPPDEEPDKAA